MDAIHRMFCPIKSEEIMPSTFSSLSLEKEVLFDVYRAGGNE